MLKYSPNIWRALWLCSGLLTDSIIDTLADQLNGPQFKPAVTVAFLELNHLWWSLLQCLMEPYNESDASEVLDRILQNLVDPKSVHIYC